MKSFITKNSLRLYVGALFVFSVVISVLLYRYVNQTAPVTNSHSVVASDTVAGDIVYQNVDSLESLR